MSRVYVRIPPAIRFWPKVDKEGPIPTHCPAIGRCWLWKASTRSGYGAFALTWKQIIGAHVFAWQEANGPVPSGMVLDHLCRVTICCNPAHLEPVTNAENVRRGTRLITHCPQGHEYTPENTYLLKGARICRMCSRIKGKRRRDAERADRLVKCGEEVPSGQDA